MNKLHAASAFRARANSRPFLCAGLQGQLYEEHGNIHSRCDWFGTRIADKEPKITLRNCTSDPQFETNLERVLQGFICIAIAAGAQERCGLLHCLVSPTAPNERAG
jgi:hypothetical protein